MSKIGWDEKRAWVFAVALICVGFVTAASAKEQFPPSRPEAASNSRLLTPEEGRTVVRAAWEQDQPARGTRDCSHLVHETYLAAGFEYPYASSYELYAGAENFQRVKVPQAGDLIVWPGHVGIVADRMQHSFYSLVRTGWEAQDYESPYWKSRGRPRFYRYKTKTQEILTAAKTAVPMHARVAATLEPRSGAAAVAERAPVSGSASTGSNRPPRPTSQPTYLTYGPPAPAAAEASSERAPTAYYGPEAPSEIDPPDLPLEAPKSILVATANRQPTREDVAASISELSNTAGNVLRIGDLSELQIPVVIYERLTVERVEIKRDHGWAQVQLESRVSLVGGAANSKRRRERARWELRRSESGWEAIPPSDRTYVPHDVAVRNLAEQLARLTESDGAASHHEAVLRQEAQLASLLNVLLNNN